jgi:hypothetical protein
LLLKVAFLCTAFETLLTSKQDGRKGERIAFRTALLARHFKESIAHPRHVLQLYLLRNDVVHGTRMGIAAENEYFSLLYLIRETLDFYVRLVHRRRIQKQSDLFQVLLKSRFSNELRIWLRHYQDSNSLEVLKVLEADMMVTTG